MLLLTHQHLPLSLVALSICIQKCVFVLPQDRYIDLLSRRFAAAAAPAHHSGLYIAFTH